MTPAEEYLLNLFKLEGLLDPDWWAGILLSGKEDKGRDLRMHMIHSLRFLTGKLPGVVALLQREDLGSEISGRLTLIIPESTSQQSSPQRIISAIEGVTLLYSAMCKLHNEKENTLVLATCDSGSDKSFDFSGIPQIIEQVKNVIFGIADRVIYFREKKYSERIKCVAESLPILEQIARMETAKSLSPEQAELLRRDLIAGATKFLETGSSIPEIRELSRFQPTSLLTPAPTLLIEGPKKAQAAAGEPPLEEKSTRRKRSSKSKDNPGLSSKTSRSDSFDLDDLSDSERQKFMKILSRVKQDDEDED